MTIIAAITDDREGRFALVEAVAEAKQLGGDLVVVNLGSTPIDLTSFVADGVSVDVVNRRGKDKDDSADKLPDDGLPPSAFDSLPAGLRRVTG